MPILALFSSARRPVPAAVRQAAVRCQTHLRLKRTVMLLRVVRVVSVQHQGVQQGDIS
jgi:hypothetical protein